MPATGLGIFAGVTGALMSILFLAGSCCGCMKGMNGIVECVISAIWSVFFLPVGALVASTMAASGGGMCAVADWRKIPIDRDANAARCIAACLICALRRLERPAALRLS
ncbi:MAG: hypothetical protein J3K34DRAFT_405136 [Monoraphidium minutum]|nr:MAG: hypothetical protein J3K34DRAFT_405136 [Monoraphidium minutum]